MSGRVGVTVPSIADPISFRKKYALILLPCSYPSFRSCTNTLPYTPSHTSTNNNRLSFVTEQVAEHTNGTIGALLNATFGNAPELLISVAALRAGYYRVVQLAMLGSMLTNMLFVFGVSCFIGGLRWQVQELRITSGNINVVMLLVATAGCLFPAALKLSGQYQHYQNSSHNNDSPTAVSSSSSSSPLSLLDEMDHVTPAESALCRINAVVMLVLYICYLLFQLGTHKEEYDEDESGFHAKRTRRNLFCVSLVQRVSGNSINMGSTHNKSRRTIANTNNMNKKLLKSPLVVKRDGTEREDDPVLDEDYEDVDEEMPLIRVPGNDSANGSTLSATEGGGGDLDFSERTYNSNSEHCHGDPVLDMSVVPQIQKRRRRQQANMDTTMSTSRHRHRTNRSHPTPHHNSNKLNNNNNTRTGQHDKQRLPLPNGPFSSRPPMVRDKSKSSDSGVFDGQSRIPDDNDGREVMESSFDAHGVGEEHHLHTADAHRRGDNGVDCYDDSFHDDGHLDDSTVDRNNTSFLVDEDDEDDVSHGHIHPVHVKPPPVISMRVGVVWLFIITVCISAMSDILVDTIDGFAQRMNLSQVFTSMVIIPFFSNVAEQVSSVLFAYRNEMDLCVGVTVGSAVQIATFVLPGSVLIGYVLDRSMTLFFHGYETVCLFFAVVVVASILQGGTTNWMTGAMLVGIYVMLASGIWFHELENLTIDAEEEQLLWMNNNTGSVTHGNYNDGKNNT